MNDEWTPEDENFLKFCKLNFPLFRCVFSDKVRKQKLSKLKAWDIFPKVMATEQLVVGFIPNSFICHFSEY